MFRALSTGNYVDETQVQLYLMRQVKLYFCMNIWHSHWNYYSGHKWISCISHKTVGLGSVTYLYIFSI